MKIPPSTPKINRAELSALIAKAHPDWDPPAFLVVGIRGYYKDSMGKPGENDRAVYDDAIILLTHDELHAFNGNCDPSRYKPGIAKLKAGIWRVYKFDTHHGSKGSYPAICQRYGGVTVIRDDKGEDTGSFGINIHQGGYNTTSSLGCQTVPPTQWIRFKATADRLAKKVYGDVYDTTRITYLLLEN